MTDRTFPYNVALVLQGGGARGAFTAGVLDVLMENGLYFPYVIGTSAGGLNAVNYISRDIGRSKYVTTVMMSDKKFLSLRNRFFRGTVFNFAYLFHTVPKSTLPFNFGEYNSSPVEFVVVATCLEDGKPHYFKKGKCKEFYKALAASASLPIASNPVDVEGLHYLDGGVTDAVAFRHAFEEGFQKLIVVETRQAGYRKKPAGKGKMFLSKLLYGKYKKFIQAYRQQSATYNRDMDELDDLERQGKIFMIRPRTAPNVKIAEKDSDKLIALYEQGRSVAESRLLDLIHYLEA